MLKRYGAQVRIANCGIIAHLFCFGKQDVIWILEAGCGRMIRERGYVIFIPTQEHGND